MPAFHAINENLIQIAVSIAACLCFNCGLILIQEIESNCRNLNQAAMNQPHLNKFECLIDCG